MIYEPSTKSKVLAVHAIKACANGINKDLKELSDKLIYYVLCKHADFTQRIVSIYANELINIKSKYEASFTKY